MLLTFSRELRCVTTSWEEGNFHLRQNLQKLVFPDGVLFDKKIDGYRTEIDNAVFDIFRRFSDDYKNNKGAADESLSLFVGAARLERATACTPCKNASQLHHAPIALRLQNYECFLNYCSLCEKKVTFAKK